MEAVEAPFFGVSPNRDGGLVMKVLRRLSTLRIRLLLGWLLEAGLPQVPFANNFDDGLGRL